MRSRDRVGRDDRVHCLMKAPELGKLLAASNWRFREIPLVVGAGLPVRRQPQE